MAAANYCLRGDLSDEMQVTDPNEDARIDRTITDASRVIDTFCNQLPGAFAAQTQTRTFDIRSNSSRWSNMPELSERPGGWGWTNQSLYVPPLLAVTTLKTDDDGDGVYETTWTATTDYLLWPRNLEVKRRIDRNIVTGRYFLPQGQSTVQIAGSWGILEDGVTPYPIRRACLLLAMIYYRRPSSLGSQSGSGLGGAAVHIGYSDVDVAAILWEVAGKYREHQSFA